ncbi:hypothetical protein M3Y98_00774600 [Aphelenchoides besseyi]|nr:hypothetical protein M3Y98_00774600 [Aphelenchoides besseyi]
MQCRDVTNLSSRFSENVEITKQLQELGRLTTLNRSLSAIVYVDDDMEGLLRNGREYRIEDEALNAEDCRFSLRNRWSSCFNLNNRCRFQQYTQRLQMSSPS